MKKDNEGNNDKLYIRETLQLLPENENKVLNLNELNINDKFGIEALLGFHKVNLSHLYFYHYNCESVNDLNWGCAWRSMQSVLKFQLSLSNQNKDKDISFYNLFMKYGSKDKLLEIFMKMKEGQDYSKALNSLLDKKFAPFETKYGWAEPFISQLILYDFGFEGELILINGYSSHNYTPKEVFNRTLNFKEFKELLKTHFMQNNPGPIIVDDSYISVSIFGVKFNEVNNNVELLILDPHASVKPICGVYIIVLNDLGDFVEIIPNQHVLASQSIAFNQYKFWTAYIPKSK